MDRHAAPGCRCAEVEVEEYLRFGGSKESRYRLKQVLHVYLPVVIGMDRLDKRLDRGFMTASSEIDQLPS